MKGYLKALNFDRVWLTKPSFKVPQKKSAKVYFKAELIALYVIYIVSFVCLIFIPQKLWKSILIESKIDLNIRFSFYKGMR